MRRTVEGLGVGKVIILSSINYGCRVLSKENVCRFSSGFLYLIGAMTGIFSTVRQFFIQVIGLLIWQLCF